MDLSNPQERREAFPVEQPRPETWAASPVDLYATDAIQAQQANVGLALQKRADEAARLLNLPKFLGEYLFVNVMQRFHHESQRNQCSYNDRIVESLDDVPDEYMVEILNSMNGIALPSELLTTREVLGMPSVELAKLSHVGGIQIEQLPVMRGAVDDAILARGGYLYGEHDSPELKLISGDSLMLGNGEHPSLSALTMTRKRYIGTLPDGTEVREKSQFILCIDEESGFDGDIAERIRRIKIEDGETWRERVENIRGFNDAVMTVLASDNYRTAIPLCTTIYACNKR